MEQMFENRIDREKLLPKLQDVTPILNWKFPGKKNLKTEFEVRIYN